MRNDDIWQVKVDSVSSLMMPVLTFTVVVVVHLLNDKLRPSTSLILRLGMMILEVSLQVYLYCKYLPLWEKIGRSLVAYVLTFF